MLEVNDKKKFPLKGVRGSAYFLFCKGDILLTKEGTVPFGISAPIELKPWKWSQG